MAGLPGDNHSTVVTNPTELSRGTTMELTDSEVQDVFKLIVEVQERYKFKFATAENLAALRDEVLYRLMEHNILATFDPTPILNGEAPQVEIVGKISSDPIHKHGFDHEKEQWEVQRANERSQEVYDEKG